jgi:hypothetical protein
LVSEERLVLLGGASSAGFAFFGAGGAFGLGTLATTTSSTAGRLGCRTGCEGKSDTGGHEDKEFFHNMGFKC